MLVVTANWALADGTLVAPQRRGQQEFLEAVHRAALRSGVRRDGRYEPIDGIDVVLAGDTFDGLTSSAWTGTVRPWHEGTRAAGMAAGVLLAAAARGRRLLAGLAAWARDGLTVPAADRRGRPAADRRRRVPVRVTILPGDRDPWVAGAAARLARRGVRVAAAWAVAGVSVCHGAELDPLWGVAEPGRPTLGASLAVDLVARFGNVLRGRPDLWPACRPLVARLATARPADMPGIVGDWLSSLERGTVVVRDAWRTAVAAWRRQARLAEPACDASFDSIDAVAAWMDGLHPAADDGARNASDVAALLDSLPPVGTQPGMVVFGHWSGTVEAATICKPGWAVEAEAAAGVTVAGVTAAGRRRGPAHAVFPDPRRPELRWRLMPEDASAPRSSPAAGAQRIVEAA
jgi:hypothetical protein